MFKPRQILVSWLVISLVAATRGWAEPLAELKAGSGIAEIDAGRLKNGEILSARGGQGSFARGVYVESCFYVRRPLAVVGEALLGWDPSKYPEDETAVYQRFRDPAAADFARVAALKPGRGADRWMLEQSAAAKAGKATELHLSKAEMAIFREETGGASAAWERVLRGRAEAVAAGGLAGVPAYAAGDVTIAAEREFRGLLGMAPGLAARFTGVARGEGDRAFYAEQSLTQGHTSFALATLTAQRGAESWQIADCTFYPSDTFYLSANLYQLWAWEGGTLVWEIDCASAPFRGYAGGLDKLFAGREMLKETAKSIELFRRAVAP